MIITDLLLINLFGLKSSLFHCKLGGVHYLEKSTEHGGPRSLYLKIQILLAYRVLKLDTTGLLKLVTVSMRTSVMETWTG